MSIITLLRNILILVPVGWWCMAPAKAAEQRIVCPQEIPRQDLRIVRAAPGWTPFVPFEYMPAMPLVSASLMFGPPSRMAISKPDEGARHMVKWTGLRPMWDGMWMACFYGDNGRQDFILSRQIDDATIECGVAYSKDAQKRVKLDIRCR